MSVMGGRRFVAPPGQQAAGASWLEFALGDLQRAIASFTVMPFILRRWSLVVHLALRGPFGGVFSGIRVAVSIGAQDCNWRRNSGKRKQAGNIFEARDTDKRIAWRRCVHDALKSSRRYCPRCLVEFLGAGVQVKFAYGAFGSPFRLGWDMARSAVVRACPVLDHLAEEREQGLAVHRCAQGECFDTSTVQETTRRISCSTHFVSVSASPWPRPPAFLRLRCVSGR